MGWLVLVLLSVWVLLKLMRQKRETPVKKWIRYRTWRINRI